MREPAHAPAGDPIVPKARNRADQRIAVRGEGEGAVDPFPDADILQHGKSLEADGEFGRDAVDVRRQQVHAEIPIGAFGLPMARIALVDAEQHAFAFLLQIGEALEVGDGGDLAIHRDDFRHVLRDQIMVLHRRDRQVDAYHVSHFARPQPRRVDHVLRRDRSLLRNDGPMPIRQWPQGQHAIAQDDLRAAFLGSARIGMGSTVRVHVAFVRVVESSLKVRDVDDRAQLLDLFGRHQTRFHFHGFVHGALGLQHLPPLWRRRQADAAGHVHADALAALLLDLLIEADGIALQCGDIRIIVECVESRRRVPGGSCRQLRALDQGNVGPAELAEVIEDAGPDDAAADDDDPIVRFHLKTYVVATLWGNCDRLES